MRSRAGIFDPSSPSRSAGRESRSAPPATAGGVGSADYEPDRSWKCANGSKLAADCGQKTHGAPQHRTPRSGTAIRHSCSSTRSM